MVTGESIWETQLTQTANNLWCKNTPSQFWQINTDLDPQVWRQAFINACLNNSLPFGDGDAGDMLHFVLGEGRFGEKHWDLSAFNRIYWGMKPLLPHRLIRKARTLVHHIERHVSSSTWPVDDSYTRFEWELLRQLLLLSGKPVLGFKDFWPYSANFALVLTHDVETVEGQSYIPLIADMEEKLGFRSSFNIVGDQVPDDPVLLREIQARGFEIGIHGWHHNEYMYRSYANFLEGAEVIHEKLKKLDAVGFRSPLNLRRPEWMQSLNIEYDLSFFDTDPFEPIPGGACSIWPFRIGNFVELPATLVQDNTLVNLLGERTSRVWLEKIEFLRQYHGMALLNSHPDYLIHKPVWNVYQNFLEIMAEQKDIWRALPRDAARWWRMRTENIDMPGMQKNPRIIEVRLVDQKLHFSW